jgi:hypothetical protein
MKDNNFTITLDKFYQGYSPLAFQNSLTEYGGVGHASVMTNVDVINGDYLTQGPGLSTLTNGATTELINYIMDKAVTASVTYGIGTTKLYKITPTTIVTDSPFPHTITNCTDGESVVDLNGVLYYFYNKSSGGDIGTYDLSSTFDDDWGSTTHKALQKAPHPVATKEDVMLFGNGQYLGVLAGVTLNVEKLDFGDYREVADVLFNANKWWIAVNTGITGTNRTEGQIYLYDGGALATVLDDETGVGVQRIGFLYRLNGIIFVAYQDLSSAGFIIGYISGTQIKPLARFTGELPTFAQKTLYKGTILFLSSGLVYSAGALIPELPFQLSQHADGGFTTCGAIAAPFGTPMISSTQTVEEVTSYKVAKFSGYDTNCSWKSIIFPVSLGKIKGYIDDITVLTKALGANARVDLTIEADQAVTTSNSMSITGTGKTRHLFSAVGLNGIEDFRVALSWANGNTTNDCPIRKIVINGHFVENA